MFLLYFIKSSCVSLRKIWVCEVIEAVVILTCTDLLYVTDFLQQQREQPCSPDQYLHTDRVHMKFIQHLNSFMIHRTAWRTSFCNSWRPVQLKLEGTDLTDVHMRIMLLMSFDWTWQETNFSLLFSVLSEVNEQLHQDDVEKLSESVLLSRYFSLQKLCFKSR